MSRVQPIVTGDPAVADGWRTRKEKAENATGDLCGSSPSCTNLNESEGIGAAHRARTSVVRQTGPDARPLYHPSDRESLSELVCFVRSQIDVFVATAEDAKFCAARGGNRDVVKPGRVGIRCRWCCNPARNGNGGGYRRTQGAISYPKSVRLVYQSVRNFQRFHLLSCSAMPDDIKHYYLSFKSQKSCRQGRSKNKSSLYWEEQCRSMGMVDTDHGIMLRQGWTFNDMNEAKEADKEEEIDHSEKDSAFASCPQESTAVTEGERQGGWSFEGALARTPPFVDESLFDDVSVLGLTGNEASTKSETIYPTSQEPGFPAHDALQALTTSHNLRMASQPSGASQLFMLGLPTKDAFSAPAAPSLSTIMLDIPPEVMIEQVGLAHEIVKIVGEMCPLPPSELVVSDAQQQQLLEHEKKDMTAMGVELYELFSGRHPLDSRDSLGSRGNEGSIDNIDDAPDAVFGTEYASDIKNVGGMICLTDLSSGGSGDSDGDDEGGQQHKRRGKRGGSDASKRGGGIGHYVPLSVLGLPPVLCSLVSSLLDGDGFYSTVHEVEEDLKAMCENPQRFLFETSTGTLDVPKDALFGRGEEMRLLLDAYDRAVSTDRPAAGSEGGKREGGGTVEVVMISGYSGTGKSSIVQAARSDFVSRGARFVSGKFDAMRQIRPLSAIVSALNEYCDLLADMNESDLAVIREAIVNAVGGEVQVLIDLIPNLGRIIDLSDEPSLTQDGREAQQRLMFLFRILLRETCSPIHPIVLFLDDLQWADEASLELLHVLVTDIQVRGLLFVGCYRDNEVNGPDHPLMSHLEDLHQTGIIAVTTIRVGNLDRDSINTLVSHSLRMVPRTTRSLSDAVVHKTGGNALFAVQLLVSLVDSGLLWFSLLRRQWEWDLSGIRARDIADNVVELMTAKLLSLPHDVQAALRVVAAFGAQCQDEVLQILDRGDDTFPYWDSSEKMGFADFLSSATAEGLMVKIGMAYRFSHDQVQRAAYLLIPEAEQAAFHLCLGRCLWKWSTREEMDEYLFVVVDQLHRGADLIVDREEKVNLAQLCLQAGEKAFGMSSFLPASVYFKAGIALLADEHWTSNRSLCLALHNSCAETEFILADFPEMQKHLEQVFGRARSLQEELRAYYTLVQSLGSQGNSSDAISTSIKVLEHLGVEFPLVLNEEAVKQDVAMTVKLVRNMTDSSLLHLETMRDTEKKEAMRFLNVMALYAYLDNRQYYTLVINHMVRLSLSYGVCRESSHAFAGCGMVMCVAGDIRSAYRFGKLAMALLERFQAKEFHAKVCCAVDGFIKPWIEPIQSCLPNQKQAVNVGLSTGDTEFAMANANIYLSTALNTGQPLGPLREEIESYSKQMLECCQLGNHKRAKVLLQTTLSLLDESADPVELIGEGMDKEDLLDNPEDEKREKTVTSIGFMVYFYRMWVAYLFGRYDVAAEMAEMNVDMEKQFWPRVVLLCNHKFYKGLAALALGRKMGGSKWREIAEKCIEQIKVWAELSEWNCKHKLELLNAEYAYLQGDFVHAAKAFANSIKISAKHRFIHEQALALERAGIFHLETGCHSTASGLFRRAYECYSQWGALGKAKHLQEHYL